MERDPFFKERWEEKAAHEQGQEIHDKGVDLYYTLLERAQKEPTLQVLTGNLEKAIGDYADAAIRLSRAKLDKDISALKTADDHRTRMHTSVIDAINGISRWYAKQKIDNNWRSDIIGLDRDRAGAWALSIARHVLGKHLED